MEDALELEDLHGDTNAQIGLCAHRSEKTVRNQLTHLYAKLGASNRAEAVAIYMRMGGVPDGFRSRADRDIRPIEFRGASRYRGGTWECSKPHATMKKPLSKQAPKVKVPMTATSACRLFSHRFENAVFQQPAHRGINDFIINNIHRFWDFFAVLHFNFYNIPLKVVLFLRLLESESKDYWAGRCAY